MEENTGTDNGVGRYLAYIENHGIIKRTRMDFVAIEKDSGEHLYIPVVGSTELGHAFNELSTTWDKRVRYGVHKILRHLEWIMPDDGKEGG